ncbi:neutral zinc metallopeptidase [Emericellopsis atlantica]|uniref:Neutral zinc metallopeptidase n=1 Tax=Emericellopsis atlantica TaxID=2614577 RepID=A0A9P7ZF84_9HYPO|nr:neutral zinc metallopeptidase [Emericellopsis atlantica]KAG9250900.1 neutral zinc metallopeptidase [Emericellopsis atlantica]
MDYSRLRAAAMQHGEDEEAVTVDTRALIDKVLARYSGEWTTLRELIQNAADAQATTVSVKWETLPSTLVPMPNTTDRSELLKHTISNHTVRRLVVQNDGQPFTKTDWGRLKRIAEGNPDETKIGAFGVGFYSVFADCEEPFVSSGKEAMAFYWKGNALFTRKSQIPEDQATHHTTFVLDNRNTTTPLPNLLSVSQFLATSLTFVALQNVEFWIDDYQILGLKKKTSPSAELPLPADLDARTKDGIMRVQDVGRTSTQIDAIYMTAVGWKPKAVTATKAEGTTAATEAPSLRSFFARLTSNSSQSSLKAKTQNDEKQAQTAVAEDVTKQSSSTIFLRSTTASIQTKVSASFSAELERATKKPPPKTTRISILTASYDEAQASQASVGDGAVSKATDVFASVLPNKKPGGRVFIGFPTMQTTGAGLHISAPSTIPTVEREAIDLNARWVRTWNIELLRAAGIVTRLAFANEMDELNQKIRRAVDKHGKITSESVHRFMPEAAHIFKTFFFGDSTPSGQVGQLIEEAFWTCFRKASIEVYSTQGVLQTDKVRLESAELTKFVDSIPVLPKELADDLFVKKLIDFGLISHITVKDVQRELEAKSLDKSQLLAFISWAGKKSLSGELDPGSRSSLMDVAVGSVGDEEGGGEIIALGAIKNFVIPNKIPVTMPMPPSTIPHAYTVSSTQAELQALGWEALEVLPWLRYLSETKSSKPEAQNLEKSPTFAVAVLTVVSKNWDHVNASHRQAIAPLLQAQTVMPTKLGMKKPGESFFPTVKLFDDLPLIEGCDKIKEKLLVSIGVRKTVDLDTIFTRLLNPSDGEKQQRWSHMELIKYLASVQDDIPRADLEKLKSTRFCPAEAGPPGMEQAKATEALYAIPKLFEPNDSLRGLGLPILQWPGAPGSFQPKSAEGQFLSALELRSQPSALELLDMMIEKDERRRSRAMAYFIDNYSSNRYASSLTLISATRKAILPLQGSTELVMPSACFINERASVLGFRILRKDLHEHGPKFGVARDPPIADCVTRLLADPPKTTASAMSLFGYFASRIRELGPKELQRLRDAPIVPVQRVDNAKGSGNSRLATTLITPSRAYLGTSSTYGDIFDFVDFGKDVNAFLYTCGAKTEPTKVEVAHMACSEPARLLGVLQSPEKYLELLKSLAEADATLRRDTFLWRKMKFAPFLLAYKELASPNKDNLIDLDEEEAPVRQYQLACATEIVVVDDIISYRLFKENLVCAPEEDALEKFYLSLGAQQLSSLVQEEVRIGSLSSKKTMGDALKKHVLERSKIFLYEYANYRRDAIKHDTKWLEKNLRVDIVSSVALRRTLKGQRQTHVEKRSAASARDERGWVLYVAGESKPDMYQIGQALCQMLLDRPNQQAYLFFEPFLTLDLYGLRARGYNVDRILRAKAAEARVAEEERRKALESEQKMIKEREKNWAAQAGSSATAAAAGRDRPPSSPSSPRNKMPGAWDSNDDSKHELAEYAKRGKSFFSNLTRKLGFESQNSPETQKGLDPFVNPENPGEGSGQSSGTKAGTSMVKDGERGRNDDGRVTNPAMIQRNLINAVNASRAHGSSSVFTQPTVNEVKEQATYCDSTAAANITFVAEASNGIRIFLDQNMSTPHSQFLRVNIGAINTFASILRDVGEVYSLARGVLHIYYDESGRTIAFNTNGSLFCNFRYFLQLHAASIESDRSRQAQAEAATWWWVVLAHELAHNLVKTHNADHSYYTESFVQQYFGKMMIKVASWLQEQPAAARPPLEQAPQEEAPPEQAPAAEGREQPPPPYTDGPFN